LHQYSLLPRSDALLASVLSLASLASVLSLASLSFLCDSLWLLIATKRCFTAAFCCFTAVLLLLYCCFALSCLVQLPLLKCSGSDCN
jgi:hypothetical protein